MSKVTNLNDYRAGKKSPSKVGGDAHCLQCNHTWLAVGGEGTTWLECPNCHCMKGVYDLPFAVDSQRSYACRCGNSLLILAEQDGLFCPNCGVFVDEEFYK